MPGTATPLDVNNLPAWVPVRHVAALCNVSRHVVDGWIRHGGLIPAEDVERSGPHGGWRVVRKSRVESLVGRTQTEVAA